MKEVGDGIPVRSSKQSRAQVVGTSTGGSTNFVLKGTYTKLVLYAVPSAHNFVSAYTNAQLPHSLLGTSGSNSPSKGPYTTISPGKLDQQDK